jgi:predicted RNA methylase
MGTQDRRFGTVQSLDNMMEHRRLILQEQLDSNKSIEERRQLGQFATPGALSRDIVSFGLSILKTSDDIRFLDPAFGTGSFFSALLKEADVDNISEATGIEIDPLFASAAADLWSDAGIHVVNADFTTTEPDRNYNFVICNPPYVRHQLMKTEDKVRIQNKTEQVSGVKLSGLAGLYCHFLLQSHQWMAKDGIAGWLIPSEFMDVNYGKAIKEFLLSQVELLRIHRFNPEDLQFGDALVSSAVVWFRNRKPTQQPVLFSFGGSLAKPNDCKEVLLDDLKHESKWTHFPYRSQKNIKQSSLKLRDFFDVKRGIATGGNDFFIMSEERIRKLELPFEFFRPILPSARYVKTMEIESDAQGNPILPQRLFLLDCRLSEDEIRSEYPNLWAYLESGKDTVATGYLCKTRKCWYFQEQRDAPILVCTYMGRSNKNRDSAFRFILNNSKATVTNSYLALYPKPRVEQEINRHPQVKRLIWEALNETDASFLDGEGRVYGGGLQKIEPKELLNVSVPLFANMIT